jgi:hypothetical protein
MIYKTKGKNTDLAALSHVNRLIQSLDGDKPETMKLNIKSCTLIANVNLGSTKV